MKYKLGDLLEQVYETNINLNYNLDDIVGVTIEKQLIPTIANLTLTDLSKFILVKPGYFIYNPRTHGAKIGLGYNNTKQTFISTWNNNVFKIKDNMKEIVNSDYLYFYFNREIWDKEACFNAWGSSTVVLLWENFCNIKINLPSIVEQEKIVKRFKKINEYINIKKQMNEVLERISYMHFLKINKENSSSLENIELSQIATISAGGDNPGDVVEKKDDKHKIPVFSNGTSNDGLFGYTTKAKIDRKSITISARGVIGYTVLHTEPYFPIVRLISITPKNEIYVEYLYFLLKNAFYAENGTSQQQVTIPYFQSMNFECPQKDILKKFSKMIRPLLDKIIQNKKIIDNLEELKNIMISNII